MKIFASLAHPLVASIGYLGYVNTTQKFGDIYVCGLISSEAVFPPTNAAELEDFIDGKSLYVIFNFLWRKNLGCIQSIATATAIRIRRC
ncbi:unnamed protein product [Mortierella alpina]